MGLSVSSSRKEISNTKKPKVCLDRITDADIANLSEILDEQDAKFPHQYFKVKFITSINNGYIEVVQRESEDGKGEIIYIIKALSLRNIFLRNPRLYRWFKHLVPICINYSIALMPLNVALIKRQFNSTNISIRFLINARELSPACRIGFSQTEIKILLGKENNQENNIEEKKDEKGKENKEEKKGVEGKENKEEKKEWDGKLEV